MDKNAYELCKNLGSVNDLDWQKAAGYIETGYVDRVISADTVVVTRSVQDSVNPKLYIVRLLSIGSSTYEENIVPQEKDQVLLLFLHAHDDEALLSPEDREKTSGEAVVKNRNPKNYTMFTGVGILMKVFSGRAPITRSYSIDSDGARVDERTNARVRKIFNKAFSVAFDAIKESGSDEPDDEPVTVYFGPHSPLNLGMQAATDVLIGMDYVDDSVEFPSPVSLKFGSGSPLSIDSKSSCDLSFDGRFSMTGSTIELNGNGGFVTEFNALKTGLSNLVAAINTALGAKENGSGSPGTLTLDIDSAKKSTVKV